MLTYGAGNGWLEGKPAMISRALGKGMIAYLGTLPDAASMRALLTRLAFRAGGPPAYYPHSGDVEVCVRNGSHRSVTIVINHGGVATDVDLYGRMKSLLPDIATTPIDLPTGVPSTRITLPPQGVAVLAPETAQ